MAGSSKSRSTAKKTPLKVVGNVNSRVYAKKDSGIPKMPRGGKVLAGRRPAEYTRNSRGSNNSIVSSSNVSNKSSSSYTQKNANYDRRQGSPGIMKRKEAAGRGQSRSVSQDGRKKGRKEGRDREDSVEKRREKMGKRKIREDEPVIATREGGAAKRKGKKEEGEAIEDELEEVDKRYNRLKMLMQMASGDNGGVFDGK